MYAYDSRGHGDTRTQDAEVADYSIDALCSDLQHVINALFPEPNTQLILIGHSMGGAVAIHFCSRVPSVSGPRASSPTTCAITCSIAGLIVMDVVEGTALQALPFMKALIQKRPTSFTSPEEAIHWAYVLTALASLIDWRALCSVNSGMVNNSASARVSVPPQLVKQDGAYKWRVNLDRTEPYWTGWFTGISDLFLASKIPKMLLLAGTDRLDTALTVGQMQGKFQLVVLPAVGHTIQEDVSATCNEQLRLIELRIPWGRWQQSRDL